MLYYKMLSECLYCNVRLVVNGQYPSKLENISPKISTVYLFILVNEICGQSVNFFSSFIGRVLLNVTHHKFFLFISTEMIKV